MIFGRLSPLLHMLGSTALLGALAACSSVPGGKPADAPAPAVAASEPVAPVAAPVVAAPPAKLPPAAEVALADGLKAYQGGQYRQAESQLKAALQGSLPSPAEVANAHKHLAFIYCTSKRDGQCVAAFKAAKLADPTFALTKAEAGHPMWAKAYKKALGLK